MKRLLAVAINVGVGVTVACSDSNVSTVPVAAMQGTADIAVLSKQDDAEEYASGKVNIYSSDLELTKATTVQTVGMRFREIPIPAGVRIREAYIQFTADETSDRDTALRIYGEAASDAGVFERVDFDITSRARTSAEIAWSPPPWANVGDAGEQQRTPNLAAVVQEIVDRDDWRAGNAIAIMIAGAGKRVAESYNGDPDAAPVIHLDWEPKAGAPRITVTSPSEDETVSGTVPFRAVTSSDLIGERVTFRVDSEQRCSGEAAPDVSCSWDTTDEGDGPVSVTAVVTTADGIELVSPPVTVVVDNAEDTGPTEPPPPSQGEVRVPEDYATIQAAIDAAGDGDTVLVAPGSYRGGLKITGKRITLASYYHTTRDRSYIGATTIHSGEPAVRVDKSAAGTVISGLRFTNPHKSVALYGYGEVLDNIFDRTELDAISLERVGGVIRGNHCIGTGDDCVDVDGPRANTLIENNTIEGVGDDGIEIRNFTDEGATVTVTIRNNTIVGSDEDGIQLIDYSGLSNREFIIERNIILDSKDVGIGLMDNAETKEDFRAASMPERIHVINNTLDGNRYGITGGDNLFAINNIISNCSETAVKGVNGGSTVRNTLFFNNGRNQRDSNVHTASVVQGDPRFASDFSLRSTSAAIDQGTASYASGGRTIVTISGFRGAAPDVGAVEYRP